MAEFKDIPDSGNRRDFGTGSVRDVATGKPRMDLISIFFLRRLGMHYSNGCKKYGMRNWELGQPSSEYMASHDRHILEYMSGDRSEDHLAAAAWNIAGIVHNEEMIERGLYPESLHDLPDYSSRKAFDRTVRQPALVENKKRETIEVIPDGEEVSICPVEYDCENTGHKDCENCPGGHDGV